MAGRRRRYLSGTTNDGKTRTTVIRCVGTCLDQLWGTCPLGHVLNHSALLHVQPSKHVKVWTGGDRGGSGPRGASRKMKVHPPPRICSRWSHQFWNRVLSTAAKRKQLPEQDTTCETSPRKGPANHLRVAWVAWVAWHVTLTRFAGFLGRRSRYYQRRSAVRQPKSYFAALAKGNGTLPNRPGT